MKKERLNTSIKKLMALIGSVALFQATSASAALLGLPVIETECGDGTSSLEAFWAGPSEPLAVTQLTAKSWHIHLDQGTQPHSLHLVGRAISWLDDDPGFFNRVTLIDSVTLLYESDLPAPGAYGPFPPGVSFYFGWDVHTGNHMFVNVFEVSDLDCDGIPDQDDPCPESNLSETVSIDGCDSGVANFMDGNGCSLADLIDALVADCADGAKNHGAFVTCMAQALNGLVDEGLLTPEEKGALQSCVGQSSIGKSNRGGKD